MPPLIRSTCRSMNPPISIAPQKVISPSPWEKCRSPIDRFAPVDEHRVEHPGALGEVLDVLVAAVLPRRGGPRRLAGDPVELGAGQLPRIGAVRQRRQRQRRHPVGSVAISACSRAFHLASSSADGAVPISPGCIDPDERDAGNVA